MTALPAEVGVADLPTDLDELRGCVQGLLVHRDWAEHYGTAPADVRWGLARTFGPHDPVGDELAATIDELAQLMVSDDVAGIRQRYDTDPLLRVPDEFESFVDGEVVPARLPTT